MTTASVNSNGSLRGEILNFDCQILPDNFKKIDFPCDGKLAKPSNYVYMFLKQWDGTDMSRMEKKKEPFPC